MSEYILARAAAAACAGASVGLCEEFLFSSFPDQGPGLTIPNFNSFVVAGADQSIVGGLLSCPVGGFSVYYRNAVCPGGTNADDQMCRMIWDSYPYGTAGNDRGPAVGPCTRIVENPAGAWDEGYLYSYQPGRTTSVLAWGWQLIRRSGGASVVLASNTGTGASRIMLAGDILQITTELVLNHTLAVSGTQITCNWIRPATFNVQMFSVFDAAASHVVGGTQGWVAGGGGSGADPALWQGFSAGALTLVSA